MADYDAIVIGSGHNGLVSAVYLAKAGWKVLVLEQSDMPGGAAKTREVTLPGFKHDTHAANIGLFLGSDIFQEMAPEFFANGFDIVAGDQPFSNVFPDGDSVCIHRDPEKTLGEFARQSPADAEAWKALLAEFERYSGFLLPFLKMPMPSWKVVRHAWKAYREFGRGDFLDLTQLLIRSSRQFADSRFTSDKVKAVFVPWGFHLDYGPDVAGGAMFPYLEVPLDYQNGLCFSAGGVGNMMSALVAILKKHGGELRLNTEVTTVSVENGRAVGVVLSSGEGISAGKAVIANTTPGRLFGGLVGEDKMPVGFMKRAKGYRFGPGTMMIHLAMNGPVPWSGGEHLSRCSYVHVGPYVNDIALAYTEAVGGYLPRSPLLVVGQQSRLDPTRAPEGKETLWIQVRAVPAVPRGDAAGELEGADWDTLKEPYAQRVLDKMESFAPGFKERIIGMNVMSPLDLQRDNPNLEGGDSVAGSHHFDQFYLFRPMQGWSRYETPIKDLFMCGASTWPGAGLNGTSGYLLADRLV